ncbi:hypothetical protein DCC62_26125 [candidate division KSB1 bacterium]|nr:MAG: hypothetical protein DCC62_26125 [candidate division KSB1 bacterium]
MDWLLRLGRWIDENINQAIAFMRLAVGKQLMWNGGVKNYLKIEMGARTFSSAMRVWTRKSTLPSECKGV